MQSEKLNILIFFLIVTAVVLLLTLLLVALFYFYNKKQIIYFQNLETLKLDHEKNLLQSQIEVQEQTIQHISREIHDNISLSLTLAKLQLNTLDLKDKQITFLLINSTVELITKSINDLSDISKSMNAEIISQQGLIDALKNETERIQKTGLFKIQTTIRGNPVFMDAQKELVIFRIVQEAYNNIIKHSEAKKVNLELYYNNDHIEIAIQDDGIGFDQSLMGKKTGAGLNNMKTRAAMFNGNVIIQSKKRTGTKIFVSIPF